MSSRAGIRDALVSVLKEKLTGAGNYSTNIQGNVYPRLKFWDEINDFPSIYVTTGQESREYLPGDFKWGTITYAIRLYVKSEDPEEDLEKLIADTERALDEVKILSYDKFNPSMRTTDVRVTSITTDEGVLAPYGVGEVTIEVLYQKTN